MVVRALTVTRCGPWTLQRHLGGNLWDRLPGRRAPYGPKLLGPVAALEFGVAAVAPLREESREFGMRIRRVWNARLLLADLPAGVPVAT